MFLLGKGDRLETDARRPCYVRDFLALLVGTVERCLHFARGFGRGRRAEAFAATPFRQQQQRRSVLLFAQGARGGQNHEQ
jgi:hypothetical protein